MHKAHAVGPLQIQKILYPEGPSIAHVFLLHPPSGIAQDDQLRIEITADQASHSVYATPGATRWYKALPDARQPASQHVTLRLCNQSAVEWLPYENLYFNQAWAKNSLEIRLEPGCRLLGWDLHQFGRTSCGEAWRDGRARTTLTFWVNNELLWTELSDWEADRTGQSRDHHQLAGYSISGSLWAYGPKLPDADYEMLAASMPAESSCIAGLSQLVLPGSLTTGDLSSVIEEPSGLEALIIMRLLSKDPEQARLLCEKTRSFLRPFMMNTAAEELRIWAT
ncbi:MAG: urease accessory protein UreD [Burkholderiaceae bacterium]